MPKRFFTSLGLVVATVSGVAAGQEPLPVEGNLTCTHRRPAWMREGLVVAGDWATPMQRRQRIGASWTQDGYKLSDDEAKAAYRAEMGPEMVGRLKKLGVTMVLMPLWSGMGSVEEEMPGMRDAKAFAARVHAAGMRVGVYIHQGMLSREFLTDKSEAYDWLAWPRPESNFKKPPPSATESEGYPVYRNHPGYQNFMHGIIDYAVKEVKADFLHFDNYVYPSGFSPQAIEDFRTYLRAKLAPADLREMFGDDPNLSDAGTLAFAGKKPPSLAWVQFQAWVLAESYRKLADYARTLSADVATEVNASGLTIGFRRPIDLSLLVASSDAFWDEQPRLGWDEKQSRLNTSIRTCKLARLYHQSALLYGLSPLAICESLAFNNDSLGCLYWFQYNRLNWPVTTNRPADERYVLLTQFYRDHRDLFAPAESIVDVAVLRGRAVNLYGPMEAVENAYLFEQALVAEHIPFELIFDQHLADLRRYRMVVLPDVRLLGDKQIEQVLKYVESGGHAIITDQTAIQDDWERPRADPLKRFFHGDLSAEAATIEERGKGKLAYTRIERNEKFEPGEIPKNSGALRDVIVNLMGQPTIRVDAPPYVAVECARQPHLVLLKIVNFSQKAGPAMRISVDHSLNPLTKVSGLSPWMNETELKSVMRDGNLEIEVPAFDLYEVLKVETK